MINYSNLTRFVGHSVHRSIIFILGTDAYDKLNAIVSNTRLVNDIKKMSPDTQTSALESYHAVLNFWHPKMLYFSWMGTKCRYATYKHCFICPVGFL